MLKFAIGQIKAVKIADLGVGKKTEEIFKNEGIVTLYPPQEQAVKAGVMKGESMVVCTPTASGKTVIAELAALEAVKKGGQVVYIVPLRALASEKYKDFLKWSKIGFKVGLQMGDLDSKFLPQRNNADILIATAEKCDSILRSRPNWFRDAKLLVIDEIHLITTDRGPTYEVLIAKFKKMFKDVQVLGLSATIGNADELADWLGAKLVTSDWRPVKLTQRIAEGKASVMFDEARKTMEEGAQSLVFVNSRRSAEAVADKFAEELDRELEAEDKKALAKISKEILDVLTPPTAQCRRLANAVKGGAAFHHAGIVNLQRGLVEDGFRDGMIKVICCTPTLSAGINMPARKVIVRDIKRYSGLGLEYIPVLEYLQIVGRAGRPKYDKVGESVLLAANEYEKEFLEENYINGQPEDIHSQLGIEPVLRMHVLASIASGFTRTKADLFDFFGSTFFAYEYGLDDEFKMKIERILRQLDDWGFIKSKGSDFVSASELETEDRLLATPLGTRVAELYIDPETAHDFALTFEDPDKMRRVNVFGLLELFCYTTELRPLLRVTRKEEDRIWSLYYEQEGKLLTDQSDSDYLDRFKTALMLNDWIDERTEDWILEGYNMAPGLLRMKLDVVEWLAYSCAEITPHLKTDPGLRKEFQKLQMRIKHGIKEELMPLVAVKGIGRVRARLLFKGGLKTKRELEKADVRRIGALIGQGVAERVKKELAS
jgi:helicase